MGERVRLDGSAVTPGCGCWPLPGVVAPIDTATGIQECNDCGTFHSDFIAAQRMADQVGGTVHFYTPTGDVTECEDCHGDPLPNWLRGVHRHVRAVQWQGPDDARLIARETNPWVEVNGEAIEWATPTVEDTL